MKVKATDYWRTPPEVFKAFDNIFHFIADMACTHENKLCPLGYTEEEDSLSFNWLNQLILSGKFANGDYVWCNPPYSDPMPWVKKAGEAAQDGVGVVLLLNMDNSTGWFAEALRLNVAEIYMVTASLEPSGKYSSGRIPFIDANGEPQAQGKKPQVLFVFKPETVTQTKTFYISRKELFQLGSI